MKLISKLFIALIKAYQLLISSIIPPRCRFYPSCSNYAIACLKDLPIHKALWYLCIRILKCHPFHPGGNDPVPKCGCKKECL